MATINGNNGNNNLPGTNGDDTINGFGGNDTLFGRGGDDFLDGGTGTDVFVGGAGADTFVGGGGSDFDTADYSRDGGTGGVRVNQSGGMSQGGLPPDTVRDTFGTFDSIVGVRNIIGTRFNDTFFGGGNANKLDGGAGNDVIRAGSGNDTVIGGLGTDRLRGEGDADTFDFNAAAESGPGAAADRIEDFLTGVDKIDLSGVDARTTVAGNQAFAWVDPANLAAAFTGQAGQLRFGNGLLQGDRNGDAVSDFEVRVTGSVALGDVIL